MAEITVSLQQVDTSPTSEASVGEHKVLIDRPTDKGGSNRGPMGGQLLLASLGGCFMSNLIAAVQARGLDLTDLELVVRGNLSSSSPRFDSIVMEVYGAGRDLDQLGKLSGIAERGCIVSNTLKAGVALKAEPLGLKRKSGG
jgi:putative redox protein